MAVYECVVIDLSGLTRGSLLQVTDNLGAWIRVSDQVHASSSNDPPIRRLQPGSIVTFMGADTGSSSIFVLAEGMLGWIFPGEVAQIVQAA